jgi:dolichol-phosphate mannosyltransferase
LAGLRVCAVIPTYNERENVPRLLESLKGLRMEDFWVLFVDDSSPDGTAEVIRREAEREPWVLLMQRGKKGGIGGAYKDGFSEAIRRLDPDVIVEMDADLQHPPSKVRDLVAAVAGGAGLALGSRYVPGGSVGGWSVWRRAISRGANLISRSLLLLPVRDCTSGFRAYDRAAARRVASAALPSKGFEFQVATLKLLARDTRIVEVPFSFLPREKGSSKLGVTDTLRFLFAVLRMAL